MPETLLKQWESVGVNSPKERLQREQDRVGLERRKASEKSVCRDLGGGPQCGWCIVVSSSQKGASKGGDILEYLRVGCQQSLERYSVVEYRGKDSR